MSNRGQNRGWQKFLRVAIPYWTASDQRRAVGWLLVLLLLSFVSSSFLIWETLQRGELLSALAARDTERFRQGVFLFVGIIALSVPALSLKTYLQDKLGLDWRHWLTNQFRQDYFTDQAFYQIASSAIDNPDQRIAEDIRNFTQQALTLLIIFSDSTIQLIGFLGILWFISKSLLVVLFVYAVIGTVITTFVFGHVLVSINFEQLKREANFRYSLVRIRENAESIAFYQGQSQEFDQVENRFLSAFHNFNRLIRWQFNLTVFQNAYQYITFILPFVVLAPRLFAGELEIGAVSQSQAAFERVGLALGLVITQFDQLSAFVAGIERLDQLQNAMTKIALPKASIEIREGTPLALQQVTLHLPQTSTVLIRELSFTIEPDSPLLIVGESGVGKSSLLRAIAGLWHTGSGIMIRPAAQQLLFLPQRPYMILGSLRQQLLYPHQLDKADEQLLQILQQVGLIKLIERSGSLEAVEDWSKVLSLGEQQRLAFARLLLAQPRYALLDEATSALDTAHEAHLYKLLQTSQIAYASVGHRQTLLAYHQQVLQLKRDQSWMLNPITESQLQF
ncbi:MAG: ABC transporter ATP-binding protein/permease [Cyanobacteria bacterium RM1_2_2]|nr:ABC transporter ATP-binding protein/permease [Cyanobacteria bacterium RM1_2_2]